MRDLVRVGVGKGESLLKGSIGLSQCEQSLNPGEESESVDVVVNDVEGLGGVLEAFLQLIVWSHISELIGTPTCAAPPIRPWRANHGPGLQRQIPPNRRGRGL